MLRSARGRASIARCPLSRIASRSCGSKTLCLKRDSGADVALVGRGGLRCVYAACSFVWRLGVSRCGVRNALEVITKFQQAFLRSGCYVRRKRIVNQQHVPSRLFVPLAQLAGQHVSLEENGGIVDLLLRLEAQLLRGLFFRSLLLVFESQFSHRFTFAW